MAGLGQSRRLKYRALLATLLLAAGCTAGCPWPFPEINPCQQVALWPRVLSVRIVGAPLPGSTKGSEVRRSVILVLTEPPGLVLVHAGPKVRKTFCARISREESDSWIAMTETLLEEPGRFYFEEEVERRYGEAIGVGHRRGQPIIEVEDLSPQGLEATREIWCLAARVLGQRALDTLRATGPGFVERTGLPAECAHRAMGPPIEAEEAEP